tara:strand:- start:332 stop:664 length:333 start_codon:yes stop_codon:yes gene_type:complete
MFQLKEHIDVGTNFSDKKWMIKQLIMELIIPPFKFNEHILCEKLNENKLINIIPFYTNKNIIQPEEEKEFIVNFYEHLGFNTKELEIKETSEIARNIIKYGLEYKLIYHI